MSSRKCYVCSRKSSSRWFKVSEALHEDVWECFNVKERVVLGDEWLCASCRRNLTRWRESRPTDGKYFKIANSRGKRFLNNAPIARQNRKFALFSRNLSEIAPLFQLPEDVFLEVAAFWTFQISWGWDKHAATQTKFACQTSYGNCCWNGIFQTKLISMNQFCQTLRWPTNFSTCLNFRRNVNAHSWLTLSTSLTRRKKNFWRKMQSLSID